VYTKPEKEISRMERGAGIHKTTKEIAIQPHKRQIYLKGVKFRYKHIDSML
jgi:hypothetical protein